VWPLGAGVGFTLAEKTGDSVGGGGGLEKMIGKGGGAPLL